MSARTLRAEYLAAVARFESAADAWLVAVREHGRDSSQALELHAAMKTEQGLKRAARRAWQVSVGK